MSRWMGKIGFTAILAALAYMVMQSPLEQRSFATMPNGSNLAAQGTSHLSVVSTLLPSGVQQIVVVDTQALTMAAYHIEPAQGKIQLRSVRRLAWDLQMEQFNAESPLPSELRAVQP